MTERTVGVAPVGDADDRCFDTAEGSLASRRCGLRRRPGVGWVATIPRPGTPPSERDDVVVEGRPSAGPPAAALALMRPLTLGAPVAEVECGRVAERSTATPVGRASARIVIADALTGSVEHLLLHLPAARIGADPEGVHQARVATRRLRSDLKTYRPLLDRDAADAVRSELRPLAAALGSVRDADVLARLITDRGESLDDPVTIRAILDVLAEERSEHRRELIALLDAPQTPGLYRNLVELAADPPTVARALGSPTRRLAPLVARPWRRLRRLVDRLGDDPPVESLHEVRIAAKAARYAAEAVSPAFGKPARRFATDVAGLQDVLGDLNDAEVMGAWLRAAAPRLTPDEAFGAGRLAQLAHDEAMTHRGDWRAAYDRAARRKRTAWFT